MRLCFPDVPVEIVEVHSGSSLPVVGVSDARGGPDLDKEESRAVIKDRIADVLGCAWLFGALTLFLWLTGVQ